MVKDRSVFLLKDRGRLLLRVIGKEQKHWMRLKEQADAQLTALEHPKTAFTAALGREPVPEHRGPGDAGGAEASGGRL